MGKKCVALVQGGGSETGGITANLREDSAIQSVITSLRITG